MCTHDECMEHREISGELHHLLGLLPHQPSVLSSYAEIRNLKNIYPPVCGGRDNSKTLQIKEVLDAAMTAGDGDYE